MQQASLPPFPLPSRPDTSPPCGRLVLVLETHLAPASYEVLHEKLKVWHLSPEPTFLASLATPSRVAALRADRARIFYNTADDLTLDETLSLLPWREVWLLNNGKFWQGMPPV
jgi:hypothetical protein